MEGNLGECERDFLRLFSFYSLISSWNKGSFLLYIYLRIYHRIRLVPLFSDSFALCVVISPLHTLREKENSFAAGRYFGAECRRWRLTSGSFVLSFVRGKRTNQVSRGHKTPLFSCQRAAFFWLTLVRRERNERGFLSKEVCERKKGGV